MLHQLSVKHHLSEDNEEEVKNAIYQLREHKLKVEQKQIELQDEVKISMYEMKDNL